MALPQLSEELELMQATDVLAKLPEGLIQELIHMMEEGLPGEPGSGNLRIWM